jgi:malonyl CoA-acyl carrier protein transacylase
MPATLTDPHSISRSATGWDTEVFVIRGTDRAELRNRISVLAARVEQQPDVTLAEWAVQAADELEHGGARVGIVASSTADLLVKLQRATTRLTDPKCQQIRDAAGIYFSAQPLFHTGTIALLFPGEGAQYPDMLLDLCGVFPEVEETFAWCDRLATEAGQPSLRRILHPAPEDRDSAKIELRKLGPSIFGVLIADLALTRVLQNLELSVAAVAGHSAGELAALVAAGAMRSESVLGGKLPQIIEVMQRQEDEAGGSDVALLAVGASKATVEEITRSFASNGVMVAMDNCPHQCVAVGPTRLIATVEANLLERGLVCERLPFRRPYHTTLFEPWMGPFHELFASIPFETPYTPIYSCSTGSPFPDDPAAIRKLAVNHWVSPVEFARMVETMYADGVRIFVEAGPRGNLSAFVEDILRGKSFLAVPANVMRKSGPTQINHLVAQLAVHQVPLNLQHLHSTRVNTVAASPIMPKHTRTHAQDSAGQVMDGFFNVMEQFLDVQREVMVAYLGGSSAPTVTISPDFFVFPDFSSAIQDAVPAPQAFDCEFALMGEITHLEPGCEIIVRRVLDGREDLYADDHTLGGRGVSKVDPGQNGLPVLPMTFSLEAMAQAASLLVPGKVVTAIRNIRLFRWLPFDPEPTTLEIRASVHAVNADTGVVEVKADVRDLGNAFIRDGANKPGSEAVLVLADAFPGPQEPKPFQLTDEHRYGSTIEDLQRNMFHGPLFQMLLSIDRSGKEGIEGTAEVKPRDRWFRSNPDPRIVLDPMLLDATMHIIGAWHLEQPDWTGRILLPYEVQQMEFFTPPPAVGTRLVIRGHNEQESARHYRHGLEVFTPDGKLWMRMTGAGYWRFYLPFGHVNFFGPKDEYFLSRNLPDAVTPRPDGATPRRCHFLEPPVDLMQPVLRAAGARVTMTPRELAEFWTWKGTDTELNNWFFSRMLAKDAVRAVWFERHGEAMFPADIETEVIDGRIVCSPRGESKGRVFPPVAVASASGKFTAFSAFAPHVGIAMVPVPKNDPESEVRSRAARLAVADALRVSQEALSVEPVTHPSERIVRHSSSRYRVQTSRQKEMMVATTLCEVERT